MNGSIQSERCPQCQTLLPQGAPHGLCPKCLLAAVSRPTEPDPKLGTAPAPETLASAFPGLELLELIGQGGMGWVYKARQPKLDRLVALKVLSPLLASNPSFAERFAREARVLARLNHPNIVSVYDFGQVDGHFYLVMELVDGVNLRQAMRTGRFSPEQALALVPPICEALQFAHGEGILHRDIKPENILLDIKGRVKIADFGIAKLAGDVEGPLTGSGMALGTPHYMAPEQLERPEQVDHRADIYSLGVVFYEMLTGELPLGRFSAPSSKATVDSRVDEVVLRALEKERERRFQSAAEVKTEVETIRAAPMLQAAAVPGVGMGGEKRWNWISWLALGSALFSMPTWVANLALTFNISALGGRPLWMLAVPGGLFGLLALALGTAALVQLRNTATARGSILAAFGVGAAPLLVLLLLRPTVLQMVGLALSLSPGAPASWLIPASGFVLLLLTLVFVGWCHRWALGLSPRHARAGRRFSPVIILVVSALLALFALPVIGVLTYWMAKDSRHVQASGSPMALLRPFPNDATAVSNRGRRFNAQLLAPGGHVLVLHAQMWSNGAAVSGTVVEGFVTVPVESKRSDLFLGWSVLSGVDRARGPWNLMLGASPHPVLYPPNDTDRETEWMTVGPEEALVIPDGGVITLPILKARQDDKREVRLTIELVRPEAAELSRLPYEARAGEGTNWRSVLAQVKVLELPDATNAPPDRSQ